MCLFFPVGAERDLQVDENTNMCRYWTTTRKKNECSNWGAEDKNRKKDLCMYLFMRYKDFMFFLSFFLLFSSLSRYCNIFHFGRWKKWAHLIFFNKRRNHKRKFLRNWLCTWALNENHQSFPLFDDFLRAFLLLFYCICRKDVFGSDVSCDICQVSARYFLKNATSEI